jgi:hypothetical protein
MLKTFDPNSLLEFNEFIEEQVSKMQYGTITFNVMLVNGMPKSETCYFIINKRIKYPITNEINIIDKLSEIMI